MYCKTTSFNSFFLFIGAPKKFGLDKNNSDHNDRVVRAKTTMKGVNDTVLNYFLVSSSQSVEDRNKYTYSDLNQTNGFKFNRYFDIKSTLDFRINNRSFSSNISNLLHAQRFCRENVTNLLICSYENSSSLHLTLNICRIAFQNNESLFLICCKQSFGLYHMQRKISDKVTLNLPQLFNAICVLQTSYNKLLADKNAVLLNCTTASSLNKFKNKFPNITIYPDNHLYVKENYLLNILHKHSNACFLTSNEHKEKYAIFAVSNSKEHNLSANEGNLPSHKRSERTAHSAEVISQLNFRNKSTNKNSSSIYTVNKTREFFISFNRSKGTAKSGSARRLRNLEHDKLSHQNTTLKQLSQNSYFAYRLPSNKTEVVSNDTKIKSLVGISHEASKTSDGWTLKNIEIKKRKSAPQLKNLQPHDKKKRLSLGKMHGKRKKLNPRGNEGQDLQPLSKEITKDSLHNVSQDSAIPELLQSKRRCNRCPYFLHTANKVSAAEGATVNLTCGVRHLDGRQVSVVNAYTIYDFMRNWGIL